jgi:hypothetical protein
VQGNTWKDCHWDGSFTAEPLFAMCRHGSNSQGSENLFLNCHFNNPYRIAYENFTYNALQQTFIGGDFSQHHTGIYLHAGSVNLFSVGFQARKPQQLDEGGEDIHISNSADTHSSIIGCRSESYRTLGAYNQHYVLFENNNADSAAVDGTWQANHAYAVGKLTSGITNGNGNGHLHRCIVGGTSGATEPVWNDSASPNPDEWHDNLTGVAITSGSTPLDVSGGLGTGITNRSRVGQGIIVTGAGVAGANLYTFIDAVLDSHHYTLHNAASTTVTMPGHAFVSPVTTDGTCQWIQQEFTEVFLSTGILRGNSFRWGKVAAAGNSGWIELGHNTYARNDPFRGGDDINAGSEQLLFPLYITNLGRTLTREVVSLNGGMNSGVQSYTYLPKPAQDKALATSGTIAVTMDRPEFTITPTADCTVNATGGTPGDYCTFVITTSGTRPYKMTFGTNFKSTGSLTTGTASGKVFSISFICKTPTSWVETARTTAM